MMTLPYPEQAIFCADLAHLRDTNVSGMVGVDTIDEMMSIAMECVNSIKDALCLDAFPTSNNDDLTPCMMACRNNITCYDETFTGKSMTDTDKALHECVKQCQTSCSKATGLNKVINFTSTTEEFESFACVMTSKLPDNSQASTPVADLLLVMPLFAPAATTRAAHTARALL